MSKLVPFSLGEGWDGRVAKLLSNIQPNFLPVFANNPKSQLLL